MGCLYTPLKQITHMPPALEYDPIRCKGCAAVLNPYCRIDYQAKVWFCPFCARRNQFPPHYAQNITETQMPGEASLGPSFPSFLLPCSSL